MKYDDRVCRTDEQHTIPNLETDEKRIFSQVRSRVEAKELKIEHEFKDSTQTNVWATSFFGVARSSTNSALKTLAIMVETAFKTTLIQPNYGSMS